MIEIAKLETWYQENHRKLKFRETKIPYHVWVSEIMLQQTQVSTVLPYFEKWIATYPNIQDVASASLEDILKLVEGIGYYRRFRLLHEASKKIVDIYQGIFPSTYEDVLKLPGIGRYTAGAIMSIAYNEPYSAVDGNVIRVLTRRLSIDLDMRLEKNKKYLDQINQDIILHANPNIYTQALMELGATICTPQKPACERCPLNQNCAAYQTNQIEVYPNMSPLKDKKVYEYITLKMYHQDGIILRKRTESLLKDMYEYPQFEYENLNSLLSDLENEGIYLEKISEEKMYQHVFTHQIWNMKVYEMRWKKGLKDDWEIIDKDQITKKPMATAHRKIKIKDSN